MRVESTVQVAIRCQIKGGLSHTLLGCVNMGKSITNITSLLCPSVAPHITLKPPAALIESIQLVSKVVMNSGLCVNVWRD